MCKENTKRGSLGRYCLPLRHSKDLAGVSCKDDSNQGAMKQQRGPGRKAAYTYWMWQQENGTKLALCENVVTGCIHKECAEVFSARSEYTTRVMHVRTEDTGHAGVKRYRGWTHGSTLGTPGVLPLKTKTDPEPIVRRGKQSFRVSLSRSMLVFAYIHGHR